MEETPQGTPVGVNDPYEHADACDHLTDDGRCRYALNHADEDPAFAREREREEYACVAAGDASFRDCPYYRSTTDGRACRRCGLREVRMAHDDSRPLVEEHHLSYGESDGGTRVDDDGDADEPSHEITVGLCRWCHAKIHAGWARVADGVEPDPEAIAERESRRSAQLEEADFSTAAERRDS